METTYQNLNHNGFNIEKLLPCSPMVISSASSLTFSLNVKGTEAQLKYSELGPIYEIALTIALLISNGKNPPETFPV